MKILHLCPSFSPNIGGVEQFILELATRSREAGADVSVLTLDKDHASGARLPAADEVEGVPVRRVRHMDLRFYKPANLPIAALGAADILHVHNVGALLDLAVLTKPLHRRPILVSTHGGIFHTPSLALLKRAYFYGAARLIAMGVDLFVADSRHDHALFNKITDRLELIEVGVDTRRFAHCSLEAKRRGTYVFVGRIARNKRVDQLLTTFAELRSRGTPFTLRVIGPDWEGLRSDLENQARRLRIGDAVRFLGTLSPDELEEELCRSEFFVSASEYEGFGISAVEAMAAGCVPILNQIDSFREFVKCGVNGVLADFNDSAGTARVIADLQGSTKSLACRARDTAEQYAWDRRIEQWLGTYARIVG